MLLYLQEENLCWSFLKASNFIKKILQHKRFPVNIKKFLRTPISKSICERLILIIGLAWYQFQIFIKFPIKKVKIGMP